MLCVRRIPSEVAARIDAVIAEIKDLHRGGMKGEKGPAMNILIVSPPPHSPSFIDFHTYNPPPPTQVSHGHFLRAFTKRWLGLALDFPLGMLLEPGGIGTLR